MDVKFEVQDLFEKLRPNVKVHESLEEAAEALNEIVSKQAKPMGAGVQENVGEGSDGASEKSDDDQDDNLRPIDEEEPDEEVEQPEDMEVTPTVILSDGRLKGISCPRRRKNRKWC